MLTSWKGWQKQKGVKGCHKFLEKDQQCNAGRAAWIHSMPHAHLVLRLEYIIGYLLSNRQENTVGVFVHTDSKLAHLYTHSSKSDISVANSWVGFSFFIVWKHLWRLNSCNPYYGLRESLRFDHLMSWSLLVIGHCFCAVIELALLQTDS